MTFESPLNLLWLVPALGAIVALYLLRRPRRNVIVPSTLFWRMLPEQSARATRIQRFTPQLLFFLQVLAALLLIGAAAHPVVKRPVVSGRTWAFIIDNGSGMNATDVQPTRLAASISRAEAMARQLPREDQVAVLTTANIARVILPAKVGHGEAIAAIGNVQSTDAGSDISGAVSAASSALKQVVAQDRGAGIEIFSGGSWPQSADSGIVKAAQGSPLQLDQIASTSSHNIAVSRLSVERDPSFPDTELSVLVQVDSHSDNTQNVRLVLSVDGSTIGQKSFSISPGASEQETFDFNAPAQSSVLAARIIGQGPDDLPGDDTAWTTLPAAGKTRVLLISSGDTPLELALSLLPGVAVDETQELSGGSAVPPAGYEAYIFDGVTPPPLSLVPGNSIVFGGAAPNFVAAPGSPSPDAPVVTWDRSHPVDRFVDFSSTRLTAPAWTSIGSWTPLVQMQTGTIAAVQDEQGRRGAWFSFTPQASGFSTQIAFPIMISNLVGWLTQTSGQSDVAGTPITLAPVKNGWQITGPAKIHASGFCGSEGSACTFIDTLDAGVYTARSSNGLLLFTRNSDPGSSDIRPKAHQVGGSDLFNAGGGAESLQISWTDITYLAAAACLLLLVVEWWVYHRPVKRGARSPMYRG